MTGCSNGSDVANQNEVNKGEGSEVVKIRLEGTLPVSHHITKALEEYVDLINERRNGRIDAVYYPSGQLFEDNAILEAIPSGTVEMAQINFDKRSGAVRSSGIFSVQGLDTGIMV